MTSSGAVCLRASPGPRQLSLSGDRAHVAGAAGAVASRGLAAGLVPWPVRVTHEWMAILAWVERGTWALVIAVVVGMLLYAFMEGRRPE